MDKQKGVQAAKETRAFDYVVRIGCYLLILLPAALGMLYVHLFGVSVVRRDAWTMVPIFERWSSGTLRVSDFFVQHFEHRSAFPELVMLLLGIATKYDNVAEMYVIQICFLITLVVLLLAFRADVKRANVEPALGLLLFVPVSLLVFSLRQREVMLFGYQINFAFVVTFGVLAFFLLYLVGDRSFKKTAFFFALASATIATYSVVQGLLVWPVGLLQLLIVPLERAKKKAYAVLWGLVGFTQWVAYLWGWSPGRDCSSFIDWRQAGSSCSSSGFSINPSLLYVFVHPLAGVEFFLNLLASSIFWPRQRSLGDGLLGQHLGTVASLLVICLALGSLFIVYKDKRLGERAFWVSVVLYSFLIVAAITLGRSAKGAELALAPRYTTFSILAVVSVYGLLATTVLRKGLSIRSPSIGTILLIFVSGAVVVNAAVVSYPNGIMAGKPLRAKNQELAYALSTYESQPDALLADISGIGDKKGARIVRERAPVLQRLGYNVFSEPQAPPPPRNKKRFEPT
jgi:hypothetical protein